MTYVSALFESKSMAYVLARAKKTVATKGLVYA